MTTDIIKQRHAVDFANLSMDCPDVDLTWLQPGYGNPGLFDQTFLPRLQVAKLSAQLGYLAHCIRQGNAQQAAPIASGLREVLKQN